MSDPVVNLERYLIPLWEINRATENFSQLRCIGGGGFGWVYKGQLSERWQNCTAAIKRLAPESYQGEDEFRNEVEMISRFQHENVISFIGYCNEANEKIIVFEYAINGSLDDHLHDPNRMRRITWTQRLMICIGAGKGLDYLHSGLGEHMRVIHRDVKSANILLDGNFVAKICDFGLSKVGPRNQPDTELYTRVAGTQFYLDPTYLESGNLRKESDIYSFGVVLFEILSGILVYCEKRIGDHSRRPLIHFVRGCHEKEPEKLIDPHIRDQIDSRSFNTFIEIAYQCISYNFKERPRTNTIIERIEEALRIQENVDAFIQCITADMGFSNGIPVAAFTIYKWLLHWKYLEAEKANIFDRLIQIIKAAIEGLDGNNGTYPVAYALVESEKEESWTWFLTCLGDDLQLYRNSNFTFVSDRQKVQNNSHTVYWLSNASALLFLIQKSLKHDSASSVSASLTTGFRSSLSPAKTALNVVQHVQAKLPALLFRQQLATHVEKMYLIIYDNLRKELGPLLAHAPRTSEGVLRSGQSFGKDSQPNHWRAIVDHLNTLLNILKENFVPPIIGQHIILQIFSYISVQIFNSLLMRRECCTFSNCEYVKAGLAELEQWCCQSKEEYAGSAWDELKHIRHAISFMTMLKKNRISYDEITVDLCPILNIHQMHRISSLYWDDELDTRSVSRDVISDMRMLMTKDFEDGSYDIFLSEEDSSRMPFSVDDLSNSFRVEDFANVKPAIELATHTAFGFLYK